LWRDSGIAWHNHQGQRYRPSPARYHGEIPVLPGQLLGARYHGEIPVLPGQLLGARYYGEIPVLPAGVLGMVDVERFRYNLEFH